MDAVDREVFANELFDHDGGWIRGENGSDEDNLTAGSNQADCFKGSGIGSRAFDHRIEVYGSLGIEGG